MDTYLTTHTQAQEAARGARGGDRPRCRERQRTRTAAMSPAERPFVASWKLCKDPECAARRTASFASFERGAIWIEGAEPEQNTGASFRTESTIQRSCYRIKRETAAQMRSTAQDMRAGRAGLQTPECWSAGGGACSNGLPFVTDACLLGLGIPFCIRFLGWWTFGDRGGWGVSVRDDGDVLARLDVLSTVGGPAEPCAGKRGRGVPPVRLQPELGRCVPPRVHPRVTAPRPASSAPLAAAADLRNVCVVTKADVEDLRRRHGLQPFLKKGSGEERRQRVS